MALDIAILGPEGHPVEMVSVQDDVHVRLMSAVTRANAPMLLRMADYYADAEYEVAELPTLQAEVDAVARAARGDAELVALLEEVRDIVDQAHRTERGIHVLAD